MEITTVRTTNRGKVLLSIVIVILISIVYMGSNWVLDKYTYITTDDARITGEVLIASPRISGKIAVIKVKEGDTVKKGDVLFTLENDMMAAQLKKAEATLEIAKAQLRRADNNADAKDIAVLYNTVKGTRAAYDIAKLYLDFMSIKASSSGTVVHITAHPGEIVTPGLSVVSLIDLTKLRTTAYILDKDLEKVKVGQSVKLSINAFPGKTFKGKVSKVGLVTSSVLNLMGSNVFSDNYNEISQRVPITINLTNTGSALVPGMSATAKIKITR